MIKSVRLKFVANIIFYAACFSLLNLIIGSTQFDSATVLIMAFADTWASERDKELGK